MADFECLKQTMGRLRDVHPSDPQDLGTGDPSKASEDVLLMLADAIHKEDVKGQEDDDAE